MILDSEKLALKIVEFLDEKKAQEISALNIKDVSLLADYFIICSGTSSTQIKALADYVEEKMSELGYNHIHKEGYASATWVLLDYGDIIVHIFHKESRSFYNLERLWSDAPCLDIAPITGNV